MNRLKDSDVTWLYGPLHTVIEDIGEKDRYAKPKIASTEDTLGLMTPHRRHSPDSTTSTNTATTTTTTNTSSTTSATPSSNNDPPLKSVLKKVTASDLLRRSASELQANQITADHEQQQAYQNDQKKKPLSQSALSLKEANKKSKAFSPAIVATHRQPKLRFNQYVEQCVALSTNEQQQQKQQKPRARFANILSDEEDDDKSNNDDDTNDDDDDRREEEEEEEEEGYSDDENAIIINYDHPNRSLPRSSIKKIEPARLKTSSQSEQETDEVSSLSSSASSNNAWMVGGQQDHYNHHRFNQSGHIVSTSSSSDEEDEQDDEQQLEIRRRAHYIPSSGSSAASSPSDAIQWVGQSCVYNVHEPSDYDDDDYGFDDDDDDDDDDDWIHDENEVPSPPLPPAAPTPTSPSPPSPPSSSTTTTTSAAPLPCHPRGQQFLGKAVAVNGPSPIDADEPSITRVSNYRKMAADTIHSHHNVGESSNNNSSVTMITNNDNDNENNPTILGHIAQWASSYLWPKQPSPSSSHP